MGYRNKSYLGGGWLEARLPLGLQEAIITQVSQHRVLMVAEVWARSDGEVGLLVSGSVVVRVVRPDGGL